MANDVTLPAGQSIVPKAGLSGGPFEVSEVADPNIRALLFNYRWAPTSDPNQPAATIHYSFPTSQDVFTSPPSGFAVLAPAQKEAVRTALDLVASYTNLTFTEVSSGLSADATILVAVAGDPSRAGPPETPGQGETLLGTNAVVPATIGNVPQYFGEDGFLTIVHELGHALGLKHGHEGSPNGALAADVDDNEFSVMTYASWLGSPPNLLPTVARDGSSPQSFMMYDIAALQAFYGANYSKVGTSALYRGTGRAASNPSMAAPRRSPVSPSSGKFSPRSGLRGPSPPTTSATSPRTRSTTCVPAAG